MRVQLQALVHVLVLGGLALSSMGCELIASVDRDKIREPGASVEGGGFWRLGRLRRLRGCNRRNRRGNRRNRGQYRGMYGCRRLSRYG